MTSTNTYGRQVVVPLTNKSGGSVAAGDVVVIDTSNNDAFTTSTAGAFTGLVGVAQQTIASNDTGRILTSGYAALVNTSASVTRGNYGKTHTVAKQAVDAGSSRTAGTFCQFLTGGTTPDAHLFGLADNTSGAGTGTLTTVKDEGSNLSTAVASIDFVGPGVAATGTTAVTATVRDSGGELDYVAFTSTVTPTATTEATANTLVTGSAVSYDGSTAVMIHFFAPDAQPETTGGYMYFCLYDGSSSIGLMGFMRQPGSANNEKPVDLWRRLTPSNASHTYSIRAYVNTGTGHVDAGSGGVGNAMPGFIRITRV